MSANLTPVYSGKASKEFWRRLDRIKDDLARDVAYTAAWLLLKTEEQTLRVIRAAEDGERARSRTRRERE